MKLQILRRSVQGLALLVIVALPLLSLYAHYRAAGVIDDDQLMAGLRGEVVTKFIHPYVDNLEHPQAFLDGNKGTLWSMRVFGVNLTDPLAAVEMLAASKHVHWPLIASIAIPVVLALLLGKVFCSWICPGYVLFEITGKLRKLLRLAEIEPGRVKFAHRNKYIVLAVGLAIATIASAPLFALVYPPAVISRTAHASIFGTALTGMVVVLAVIVAVEVFVSPRWWCRTVCPGGALYGLLGWMRPLRVKLVRGACTGCMDCIPVCEAGINPITQSSSIECDNCGACIRHCGPAALVFTIGLPDALNRRRPTATSSRSRGLQSTRTSARSESRGAPAAAATTLILTLLLFADPASGHHILGLPHYSYKENYPQRPTLEYPATTGPYRVLLTSYPGVPTPGEPANLALYIKDHEADRVYTRPVSVRVLQTSTFGDNKVILPPTTREPFDNEYKFYVTFPTDGEYIVELSMMIEGRVETIPFLMVAGEPTAAGSVVLGGSLGVILMFVAIRAVQKKKRLRPARREQLCAV